MSEQYYFPGVTLLITHYNRTLSLERLLSAFRSLGCRFEDTVVSDDGSKPEQIEKLEKLSKQFSFRLITTPKNTGFAGNMNRGQAAVQTPFTLYVQEDFVPLPGCQQHLLDALTFINQDPAIDYIRFWSHYRYPVLEPYGKGFSRIVYSPWNLSHLKFFMYSDNPHLRRSTFIDRFGRYREDKKADVAEYMMSVSFMQKGGNGLFYEARETLFDHLNSPDEPSTAGRSNWRQSANPLFRILRWGYLRYKWMKCTWDRKFMKT